MIGVISGLVYIVGFVPYIIAVLSNSTKPTKVSWLIWISLDIITLVGMIANKTVNGQMIGVVTGGSFVLILALIKGDPGWSKLDRFCLAGALVGIILWAVFQNPLLGILVSQIVIFLGSIPTFVSAWKDPKRENKLSWTLWWISCILAIIAIPRYTLADSAQPINFLLIESIMMYILFCHKKQQRHREHCS